MNVHDTHIYKVTSMQQERGKAIPCFFFFIGITKEKIFIFRLGASHYFGEEPLIVDNICRGI